MKSASLQRMLHAVLLVGTPLSLAGCWGSSCPDNGVEPPLAASKSVSADFANGGQLDAQQCEQVCRTEFEGPVVTCVRESADSVLCLTQPALCEGRRPVGLKRAIHGAQTGFACHLAEAAWLEAASVDAFQLLRCELRAVGAPRSLLRAASRSARDERRHARIAGALARRFGVAVPAVERAAAPLRSLTELALENAVEGCVRETWGALMALRQAARATDLGVRAAMSRIAPDEVRHAELAWAIDRWLSRRLNAEQRRQVRSARLAAFAELARELKQELPVAERTRLGLPGRDEAALMWAELSRLTAHEASAVS
jgi:hypothetical protein